MKIKVGEYVRTKSGRIGKVHSIVRNEYIFTENVLPYEFKKIKAHSPKIIDLIEEGDYVNGKQVYSIGTAIGNFPIINYKDGTFDIDSNIKTIVTHEQFEETEYEV